MYWRHLLGCLPRCKSCTMREGSHIDKLSLPRCYLLWPLTQHPQDPVPNIRSQFLTDWALQLPLGIVPFCLSQPSTSLAGLGHDLTLVGV